MITYGIDIYGMRLRKERIYADMDILQIIGQIIAAAVLGIFTVIAIVFSIFLV